MDNIENLFDKAVKEIEQMINTKKVVGEPITVGGNTIIPLINIGFGFGVGTSSSGTSQNGNDQGGGTGGGGGVKPVALIIINDEGVRVEPIKTGTASVMEKVVEAIGNAAVTKSSKVSE